MQEIIIRKAKEAELKVVQELNHELFLHDRDYDPFLNMNWSYEKQAEDYYKDMIAGKDGVCFVAEVGGKIVGYLAGAIVVPYRYRNIKRQSELGDTLVKEAFRGRGIGEKLFKEFVKWSNEQEVERIKVSASFDNLGAIKFYKRVGFVPYSLELEYEIKS